ncbi:helix-turn-helix domain-containing protein [Altererythrobacter aurantiacus]|uniref:Helix-turn-helix domain-containing protein n=1 Tax=Parapontixanthobacter aurantiacus TaxID=1463599 RepID=A0A844ZH32_9SPHN|nr:Crp/Fnr family transcriptional regulator [Parapontixanthobacter aurantiacus]MXO86562.1 helix-turn-helix domain-containing protein [Parapontixanthobacter aurantiacus]
MADIATASGGVESLLCRTFGCDGAVAHKIIAAARARDFDEEAVIVHRGDHIADAFFMVMGQARGVVYSREGALVVAQEYRPGDLFGALGGDGPAEQEADIVAVRKVSSLIIEAAALATIAQRHGEIGLALSRMLMTRLREATVRLYERTALSAQGRVYAELRRLADGDTLSIRPPPIVTDLAVRVGTTRETASRAINALERRGIIERSDGSWTILAPRRLEEAIY